VEVGERVEGGGDGVKCAQCGKFFIREDTWSDGYMAVCDLLGTTQFAEEEDELKDVDLGQENSYCIHHKSIAKEVTA